MTDIQESTQPAEAGSGASTKSDTATPARRPASKRGGSLSSMLLPELQQLAGSLGIASAKVRKSDLVAAIQSAQSGSASTSASRAPSVRAGRGATDPAGEAVSPPDNASHRRAVDGAVAQANGVASTEANGVASTEANGVASTEANGAAPAVESNRAPGNREPRGNDERRPDNRNSNASQSGRNGRNQQDRNGQDRSNQDRNNQDRNNQDRNNQDRNNQDRNGQSNQSNQAGDDDEFDGSRRRGRRYRDRRGRNRDRVPGASGNDVEPTVSEDDVLVPVAGILDAIEDKNAWFVRTEGYYASSEDVYVANSYVRRFNLRRGDTVTGAVKQVVGERREKYNPLVRLDTVNGRDPEQTRNRVEFTKLTPLYPQERLRLETEPHVLTTRVIDLVMPIGKGQRALIVSPPKAGKTMVLQSIANAIATNNPEVHLMVVLIDERPEEVTDMQRSVKGEVIASTFDRRPQDHITVAELSIERAKRLVELGHDVVVLLDSITRLGRAYNLGAPASGRILSGGVDSTALYPPKRFLGAARNIENGGSLTILATALVETGSAGDTVIFEEFKGTGNAELKLDRKIADKRVFPAVDVDQSSTRKEELLLTPDELAVTIKLRRVLHSLEQQQAIDLLLDRLKKTRTNIEFLMQIAKTTPGAD